MISDSTKKLLRRFRATQPLNVLLTSAVRACGALAGGTPELLVKHLPKVGTVRRALPNGCTLALWSLGDDWIASRVYWRGWAGYEPATAPVFFRLACHSRVILDVGAHVGFYSLLAAHANHDARVYAFEPLPSVYARLRRNVQLNGLGNVHCVPSAAAEACFATAEIIHPPVEVPGSASLSAAFMAGDSVAQLVRTRITTLTLDGFLEQRGEREVGLMKIDTEGTEPQVLLGMQRRLAEWRPAIVCEVLGRLGAADALQAILGPLGYRYYLLSSAGPVLCDRVEPHPEYANYLFSTDTPDSLKRRLAPGPGVKAR